MKRPLSALVVAVLAAGLAVAGSAAPASATDAPTQDLSGTTCLALEVDLAGYPTDPGVAEVTEERVVTPAVDEVSHTDYEYRHWILGFIPTDDYRWAHKAAGDANWYDWRFWKATGKTQKHVDVEAKPAVTETVVVTPAVPADPTPNTVTVTIGGVVVDDAVAFGTAFSATYALADKAAADDYSVSVSGFQGAGSTELTGTVAPCAVGDFATSASIDATTCEAATVTLTNDELAADRINGTYSAIAYLDGTFLDAFAVFEGTDVVRSYDLPADSTLVIRTGPAHGDVELDRETIAACDDEEPTPVDPATLAVTGDLVAGGDITVTGEGFAADTEYEVELHSTPQSLGTVTTDGEGAFSLDAVIPAETPAGAHDVVALLDGDIAATAPVVVAAAQVDPAPSVDPAPPVASDPSVASSSSVEPVETAAGLAETGLDSLPLLLAAIGGLIIGGLALGAVRLARPRV